MTLVEQRSKLLISKEITLLELRRTKWLFIALCCYLLSQSFAIPIIPIGPSWALWPNLSDFATGILLLTYLKVFRQISPASSTNKRIFLILIFAFAGSILSYLFYLANLTEKDAPGINMGIYQIYRFVQFIIIFWVTAHVPLTLERRSTLRNIAVAVLLFVSLGILLTYFSILPLPLLTLHLPQDPDIAGVWSRYEFIGKLGGQGWGTTGYDHSHVAVNIIMLLALSIHLGLSKKLLFDSILILLSILACLFTESRSGLASILLFAIMYWLQRPKYAVKIIILTFFIILVTLVIIPDRSLLTVSSSEGSILERQGTLLDPNNKDNLSGRDEIWQERTDFLDEEPKRWIFGSGFGSVTDSGKKAHLLFLQIILETGLIGLFIFWLLFAHILRYLYQYETGVKAIFFATIAFLASSLSQDTLYFTPAFIHFTGFYLYGVAIALQSYNNQGKRI